MTSFFTNTDRDSWLDAIATEADDAFLGEILAPTVLKPLRRCSVPKCGRLARDGESPNLPAGCARHAGERDRRAIDATIRSWANFWRSYGVEVEGWGKDHGGGDEYPDVYSEDGNEPRSDARGARG